MEFFLLLPEVVLLTRFHVIKLTLLKFKVSSNIIQLAQTTFSQSFLSFNIWKYEILFQNCNILLLPSSLRWWESRPIRKHLAINTLCNYMKLIIVPCVQFFIGWHIYDLMFINFNLVWHLLSTFKQKKCRVLPCYS